MKKATIKTIATKAGISPSGVSRVLNNKDSGQVSKTNRKKILAIAKQLNYVPDKTARALKLKQYNKIGLVLPAFVGIFDNLFFPQVAHGIWVKADNVGFELFFCRMPLSAKGKPQVDMLVNKHPASGFVFFSEKQVISSIPKLKKTGVPFVVIDCVDDATISRVNVDYFTGVYKATSYLAKKHKVIACVHGDLSYLSDKIRFQGYKKALKDAGLRFDSEICLDGEFYEDIAKKKFRELFKNRDDITAVFAVSDIMALGVLKAAKELNLKIPGDISIIGYDDVNISSYCEPPLSTVRIPMVKMGEKAFSFLYELVGSPKHVKSVFLKPELILRQTT